VQSGSAPPAPPRRWFGRPDSRGDGCRQLGELRLERREACVLEDPPEEVEQGHLEVCPRVQPHGRRDHPAAAGRAWPVGPLGPPERRRRHPALGPVAQAEDEEAPRAANDDPQTGLLRSAPSPDSAPAKTQAKSTGSASVRECQTAVGGSPPTSRVASGVESPFGVLQCPAGSRPPEGNCPDLRSPWGLGLILIEAGRCSVRKSLL
jgi:hypothetical protein